MEVMQRTAQAKWQGDLKSGSGTISTASGVLSNSAYSFHTRFEDGKGTNPEELLAAAHAGCFTMALSNQLAQAGFKADSLETYKAIDSPTVTDVAGVPYDTMKDLKNVQHLAQLDASSAVIMTGNKGSGPAFNPGPAVGPINISTIALP